MELDKDTWEKIIETNTTCKHILKRLEQGEKKFNSHDKRIEKLEQQQQLLMGKFAIIITGLGAFVTLIFNALIWIWTKIVSD
ncbi:MAG: hypothetical protein ACXQTR_02515 [Candidatus Methanospirareceae archaeon]